ncbi:MAG: hypothetical protein EOO64_05195, partial [Massilia sp.]
MKTMKWLLRRELWEHKGAFFWAPLVIAAAMVVLMGGGFAYSMALPLEVRGIANGHAVGEAAAHQDHHGRGDHQRRPEEGALVLPQ